MAETKGRAVGRSARPGQGGQRDHAETTARHRSGCSACCRSSAHPVSKRSSGSVPDTGDTTGASRANALSLAVKASPQPECEPATPDASFSTPRTALSATAEPPAEPESEQRPTLSTASSKPWDDVLAPVDDAPDLDPTDRNPARR